MANVHIAELLRADAETTRARLELARQLLASDERERAAMRARPRLLPREQRILNAIGTGKMLGKNIARLMGVSFVGSFQDTLALMVRWNALTNDEDGYAVHLELRHMIQSEDDDDESEAKEEKG